MSNRTSKRIKKSMDEQPAAFKEDEPKPQSKENGNDSVKEENQNDHEVTPPTEISPESTENKRNLRSSSSTPTKLKKDKPEENGATIENGEEPAKNGSMENGTANECEEKSENNKEDTEMDPLILVDEPCPELEFDENSDKMSDRNSDRDSVNLSPIIRRCKTRRSDFRNIPTPKTPKFEDDKETPDHSSNSDNLSTKAQVGNDSTRKEFLNEGGSTFLASLQSNNSDKFITSRKSIRDDIRKQSLRNSMKNKSFAFSTESQERAPSVKRKGRSLTPEDAKRFKESPSFMSRITSPLSNLKNRFVVNKPNSTSTPKLTSYKDQQNHLGGDFFDQMEVAIEAQTPQNRWCSIM